MHKCESTTMYYKVLYVGTCCRMYMKVRYVIMHKCTLLNFHVFPCSLHKNMVWTYSTVICFWFSPRLHPFLYLLVPGDKIRILSACTVRRTRGIYTTYDIIIQTTPQPSCAHATRKQALSKSKRLTLRPVVTTC